MAKLHVGLKKIKKFHFFFSFLCVFSSLREFFSKRSSKSDGRRQLHSFFLLLAFLAFILVGCVNPRNSLNELSNWVKDDGKIRVLATTAIVGDLVQRIGGDKVKVIAIINGNQDPHSYEVVKGDGEKFTYADIVFANGLMLEHSGSMQYQLKHHKNVLSIGNEILNKYPDDIIYVDGQLDPHIWMDIMIWSYSIDFIREKLMEINPAEKAYFEEQSKKAKMEFAMLDAEILNKMHKIPAEKRFLVTSHDAFNYFVRRYFSSADEVKKGSWRFRMQALQGLAPDEQISVLQIKEIVDHVCKYHIKVIFPESNLSRDSLEKVKEACGKRGVAIRLATNTLYGDTLGGKTYLEMLDYDADVLETNLNELD